MSLADPDEDDCPLIYANRAFADLTGYSVAECLGRNCRFLQNGKLADNQRAQMRDSIANRRAHRACLRNYAKNGRSFHNLLFLEPIYVEGKRQLFLGSQFEFSASSVEADIQRADSLSADIDAIGTVPRAYSPDHMQMRHETVRTMIETYLLRSRLFASA